MNLDAIWNELEGSPQAARAAGRRRLFAHTPVDLNATIAPGGVRGLALTVDSEAAADAGDLPATRAIEHRRYPDERDGRTVLEIRLLDASATQLFGDLAANVASAAATATTDREAVGRWITRISRWQRLLASAPGGLSPERQRGLYAELLVLREHLTTRLGITVSVPGWEGPVGGHDFQLRGGALEVKSAASHEPQVVTVNGERQLDETGTDGLHLVHVSLDVHRHAGETLPEMVDSVRDAAAETTVSALLEERLLEARYADAHEDRYLHTGYAVREQNFFAVGPGFPRLVEADLPPGVGGVCYQLVIAACMDFRVQPDAALRGMEDTHGCR